MSLSFYLSISWFPLCQKYYFKLPGNYCEPTRARALRWGGVSQIFSQSAHNIVFPGNLLTPSSTIQQQHSLSHSSGSCIFVSQWPQLKKQDGKIRHLHQQQPFLSRAEQHTCLHAQEKGIWDEGWEQCFALAVNHQILVHRSMLPPRIPCIFNVWYPGC